MTTIKLENEIVLLNNGTTIILVPKDVFEATGRILLCPEDGSCNGEMYIREGSDA